jgi:hypothetical protein
MFIEHSVPGSPSTLGMHQFRSPIVATTVPNTSFHLIAEISSDSPDAIGPVLEQVVGGTVTETPEGFHVDSWMEGTDSRGLNRELLSALRRVERRTRLRAEWTADGVTDRFFDYVQKGTHPASPEQFGG